MNDNQKEPKLTYALDPSDKMVSISKVERGLSCNCRCPKCNEFLVAKRGHPGGRQPHFAHRKGSDCHGSYMTALHRLAEQIIEEEKAVMAPEYKDVTSQKLSFTQVEVELRVDRKDLQPDVVGITEDGFRWFIEIRNTHEVDEPKKAKLIESNITCLEIDVREQTLENLKSFILESAEKREWINNPNYDAQIVEAKRKRVSKVEKYVLSCTELTIPEYEDYDSRKIVVKDAFLLSKTTDGLYSQVKIISSNGTPFVFSISSQDKLETNSHEEHEAECDELCITTDGLSLEDEICSNTLDMSWAYHFITEKEREEKANEYRNKGYEVRPSSYCDSECIYRPFNGKCIYKKETFTQKGISRVVCDKDRRSKDKDHHQPHYSRRNGSFVSRKSPYVQSRVTSTNENLPFERFWTIEEYYRYLTSSNSYDTGKGYLAEIAKCDIVFNNILLLYKDPVNVRAFTPYHIAVITTDNGNLIRNNVADFNDRNYAINSYYTRLSSMRNNMCPHYGNDIDDKDLPF